MAVTTPLVSMKTQLSFDQEKPTLYMYTLPSKDERFWRFVAEHIQHDPSLSSG